jgi:uncharacterized protein (DUF1800 family)
VPALTAQNVRHLLRRTEYSDRPSRVSELLALGSIDAAVNNILDFDASPPSTTIGPGEAIVQNNEFIHFWFNRMAFDARRPFQEKLAFFWHGHFCSSFEKVRSIGLMIEQIDLFRTMGLGHFPTLTKVMSTQVAMLQFLDNNQNRATSPNQNFARELMELFVLGVGNYNERDVEASAAAWTGHTEQLPAFTYLWRPDWHDFSPKRFLGVTINQGTDGHLHGYETIDAMLGTGVVPPDATNLANRGRRTAEVAAEFISRKLWLHFAGDNPPADAISAMSTAFRSSGLSIRALVKAMLTSDHFYTDAVRTGLVRSPVEYMVALMIATGQRSEAAAPVYLLTSLEHRPLAPPDVSGWKTNAYWVNANAMGLRGVAAQTFRTASTLEYFSGNQTIRLAYGQITQAEILARDAGGRFVLSDSALVDRFVELTNIRIAAATRQHIAEYAASVEAWERHLCLTLLLYAPEAHVA